MVTHDNDIAARVARALHVRDGEIVDDVRRERAGRVNTALAGVRSPAICLAHKLRTALVVLSIAVGIFAILVVMGGRGILLETFDTNFAKSHPPTAELYTADFQQILVDRVRRSPGISDAEGRRVVTLRYRAGDRRGRRRAAAGGRADRPGEEHPDPGGRLASLDARACGAAGRRAVAAGAR